MASSPRGTGMASVITGLIVAAAAVVPLVWYTSTGSEEATAEPSTTLVTSTVTEAPVVETIVVTPDPVVVAELPESVVRALEAAGNVRREGTGELQLPTSIVNVLADNDVVLRVAEVDPEASP